MSTEVDRAGPAPRTGWQRHTRTMLGLATLVVVVVLAVLAVLRDREQFAAAVRDIGWGSAAISGLCAAGAVACGYGVWVESLGALGARMPRRSGIPVFFVSQLGKYLPGSVWPVLAQMEAGRDAGVRRRTMLSANLVTLLVSLAVGSTVACILLPLGSRDALHRFWWLFLALPFLLALLHPRLLPYLLDSAFRLAHRPALDERLRPRHVLRGAGWAALSWMLFGAHIAVLCSGLGARGPSVLVVCTGAMALAVSVGILFVPAPAGAGLREAALVVALSPVLAAQQGLAVALVSRVELIVVDLALAGLATLLRLGLGDGTRSAGAEPPRPA